MQIINPATEEIITDIPEDTRETLDKKFHILRSAQPAWAARSVSDRAAILLRFRDLLESEMESLSALLTREVGKPLQQSRNEINGARSRIEWLATHAVKWLGEEIMTQEKNLEERIRYEALGTICNISAWNYPWLVGVNVFVPALIAGNCVMYKPSEYALLTGIEIGRLLKKSGVPDEAFQVAAGGPETGEILLDLPFDGYFFTGSYATGKRIYERVAPKLVPCQLELGGKDPLYVADDIADLKQVASATADGAFYNNGQSCCAVERIYVHEKIYDEYVKEFLSELKTWKMGDPAEPGVYFGPLTRKAQIAILEQQVIDAKSKGAQVVTGGKKAEGKGNYFEPTVLTNVNHEMKIMREESFGPVIGIMKVKNDEEAFRLMADTDYGLTAAVYSASRERAERILSRLNTGTGYWNCCDRVSAPLPWSGRGHSGFGVTLSHAGLQSFVRPKAWHFKK